jgi:hypothetical protein
MQNTIPRYRSIAVPLGTLTIDRLTRTWSLRSGDTTIDYGHLTARSDYINYLPGRALTPSEVYAHGGDY